MPGNDRYLVPAAAVEVITEVKRSRFIAHIAHCQTPDEAMTVINQAKKRYPDARHHCWAYIACPPNSANAVRFSDDGEPSGTAGKPILNVLNHSHYGEIACVISRYFGGIKLGAGGLVRAYSNSAQAALEQLQVKEKVHLFQIAIQFPYAFESSMRHYLESIRVVIEAVNYTDQVIFQLGIEKNQIATIMQQANNLCKGDMIQLDSES
jgi:uncharacterized YigZ family protein